MNAGQFVYAWFWFDEAAAKKGEKIVGTTGKYRYVLLLDEVIGGFRACYTTTQSMNSVLDYEVVVSEKLSVKMGQKKSFKIDFMRRDFVSAGDVKSVHGSITEDSDLLRRCAMAAKAAGIL